ncbi:aromatic acid/H+ symport family MFS transporter [Pseudomonas fluorescens]|uniref:Aromatic acid/H+ symport family MFS transporter n=1 Tax=Pseudomonas fluorescens TaxID=294 RepID=A0A327MQ40_PSEFL|nr:MFS transporter [Pseudomonas fluorescens]RAI64835.1 aromatic acid/H+ symport family MFS transporter [Pseudomonas fluorescens]
MQPRNVDLQAFLDEQRFSRYQWLILAICFLIVAVDGLDTAAMGFVAPSLIAEWGVTRAELAPVMGAALFGLAIGALTAGPLADKYGRKRIILISVMIFGIGGILCSLSWSLPSLTGFRFLTGLGLGAAMPNTVTLVSEYTPASQRNRLSTLMFCGFSLGSAVSAFVAALIIPVFGWRSLLLVGGVLPVILAIIALFVIPESARFLVVKGAPAAKIATILRKIAPSRDWNGVTFSLPEQATSQAASSIRALFINNNTVGTLLLWGTYFMGLLIAYLLTGWLPLLIKDMGIPSDQAAMLTGMFMFGSTFGTVFMGWLMDRFNRYLVVAIGYVAAGICVLGIASHGTNVEMLRVLIFVTGFAMGANLSMVVLSAQFYKTQCRATGVSWMLGIGRFGGILGASIGGVLMSVGWDFQMIISSLAVPAILAAAMIGAKGLYYSKVKPESDDSKELVTTVAH